MRVVGRPSSVCEQWPDCEFRLLNAYGTVVTESGSPTVGTGDLERIDEQLFTVNRATRVPPIDLPPNYQSSFISSLDEEVAPGISYALGIKGVNVALLPTGTRVVVTFSDGTRAVYIKIGNSTVMWEWTGLAWNANGQRIHRDGSPVDNPSSAGFGGGIADVFGIGVSSIGGSSAMDFRYELAGLSACRSSLSLYVNGVQVWSIVTYQPC